MSSEEWLWIMVAALIAQGIWTSVRVTRLEQWLRLRGEP